MIERLVGNVAARFDNRVVVDVQGVGYSVELPTRYLQDINDGDDIQLWIHTRVREDAIRLYGFEKLQDKKMFELSLSVGGVGPKLGLAMLSQYDAASIANLVYAEDQAGLEVVPGIGARAAKKILLELKPKLENEGFVASIDKPGATAAAPKDDANEGISPALVKDLRSALENLGYRDREINPLIKTWRQSAPSTELGALIRLALSELSGSSHTQMEELF